VPVEVGFVSVETNEYNLDVLLLIASCVRQFVPSLKIAVELSAGWGPVSTNVNCEVVCFEFTRWLDAFFVLEFVSDDILHFNFKL
jgi:hypothetical protein